MSLFLIELLTGTIAAVLMSGLICLLFYVTDAGNHHENKE